MLTPEEELKLAGLINVVDNHLEIRGYYDHKWLITRLKECNDELHTFHIHKEKVQPQVRINPVTLKNSRSQTAIVGIWNNEHQYYNCTLCYRSEITPDDCRTHAANYHMDML